MYILVAICQKKVFPPTLIQVYPMWLSLTYFLAASPRQILEVRTAIKCSKLYTANCVVGIAKVNLSNDKRLLAKNSSGFKELPVEKATPGQLLQVMRILEKTKTC